jgi:hypothetical protein
VTRSIAQLPQTILVIAMRRSRRVAAARAAQGQAAPVDSHFGQLPIELQERIIEIVVRCGVALWPSRGMLPTLLLQSSLQGTWSVLPMRTPGGTVSMRSVLWQTRCRG